MINEDMLEYGDRYYYFRKNYIEFCVEFQFNGVFVCAYDMKNEYDLIGEKIQVTKARTSDEYYENMQLLTSKNVRPHVPSEALEALCKLIEKYS